jgi:DnaJ-class molecular chaperone
MNYYETLGIRENSSQEEIKKAYKSLAKKYHPDVSGNNSSSEDFLLIRKAYEVLSNPVTRKKYDRERYQGSLKLRSTQQRDIFTSSLFDWLFNKQFLHVGLFGSRRRLRVEIILTPEEARYGGTYMLSPPMQIMCPSCHGLCRSTPVDCLECCGNGMIEQYIQIPHRIPSEVYDGMVEYISLEQFGFPDIEVEISYIVSSALSF